MIIFNNKSHKKNKKFTKKLREKEWEIITFFVRKNYVKNGRVNGKFILTG